MSEKKKTTTPKKATAKKATAKSTAKKAAVKKVQAPKEPVKPELIEEQAEYVEFAKSIAVITRFAAAKTKTLQDDLLLDELSKVDFDADGWNISKEQIAESVFDSLTYLAGHTKTTIDDKFIEVSQKIYRVISGTELPKNLFQRIIKRRVEKRKKKGKKVLFPGARFRNNKA